MQQATENMIPDFSDVKSFHDVKQRFIDAARSIICQHILVYGKRRWQVTALELYLDTGDSGVWKDPYIHGRSEQEESGVWYVHHYQNGNWHSPQYSGIDITAGCKSKKIVAGLLLRATCNEHRWVLQRILRERTSFPSKGNTWSPPERNELRSFNGQKIENCHLTFDRCETLDAELWIGPRIGLPKVYAECRNFEGELYRGSHLRIASRKMDGKMEKLEN